MEDAPRSSDPARKPERSRTEVALTTALLVLGTLTFAQLARSQPSYESNPFVLLLLVWFVTGLTRVFVADTWPACGLSVLGSVLGYTVLVVATRQVNEMLMVGEMMVGVLSLVASLVLSVPIQLYRRGRDGALEGVR